jgi:hypothetical protein
LSEPQIQPHKITKPIQLLAVLMSGLVLLVSAFLTGARFLNDPQWMPAFLAISAVCLVPIFVVLLFLLLTRSRPQLQEDAYYAQWHQSQTTTFSGFAPENLPVGGVSKTSLTSGSQNLESLRIERYKEYRGVFLVHSWRPSLQPGQVADIVIWLQQHGEGPVSEALVDHVEYSLGPMFFQSPVVKSNHDESFRLEVSAYAPMLCLARVCLKDGGRFVLERYVNFDQLAARAPMRKLSDLA